MDMNLPEKMRRDSNIELLRIVSMLGIVLFHFYYHGDFPISPDFFLKNLTMQMIGCGGKIGVDIFVLISGYFLVGQRFKPLKILRFLSCTFFWGLAILFFAFHILHIPVPEAMIAKSLSPLKPEPWFAQAYLYLLFLYPWLNRLISRCGRKGCGILIAVMTVVFYLIPTLTGHQFGGGHIGILLLFSTLYLIGGYLRLYSDATLERRLKRFGLGAAVFLAGTFIRADLLGVSDPLYLEKDRVLYFAVHNFSIVALLIAVGVFVKFRQLRLGYHGWINNVAKMTFGVYLIHDSGILREWLWNTLLKVGTFYHSQWFIIDMVLISTGVFLVCAGLEFLRYYFLERPVFAVAGRVDWNHFRARIKKTTGF